MSRTLSCVGAAALVTLASAASAAPTSPSPTQKIGYTPRAVFVRSSETPSADVCPPRYQPDHTAYYARPYCPDIGEPRQLFITGQVIPAGFGIPIGYAQLNSALRAEYRLDPDRDYVFASGYLYDIDHATKSIRRVIPVEIQR